MRLLYTSVPGAGDAAHIGHQIAVAFMPARGCQVVARIGAQQGHQSVHQRRFTAPRRADHGGAGRIDLGTVIALKAAPVIELDAGENEGLAVTPE